MFDIALPPPLSILCPSETTFREATYIDTPDDFEMSGGRCALHAVGSSDCLLVSAAGQGDDNNGYYHI